MNINEVQFLQKMFKYFDIQNTGKVDFDQFYRSMEKTGIIMEKNVSHNPLSRQLVSAKYFVRISNTNFALF